MTSARTAGQIVELLELQRHPEGGFYRETWIGPMAGGRASGTSIYYLLTESESSRWHRIDATEIWHHYAGAALVLSTWTDGRAVEQCGQGLVALLRPMVLFYITPRPRANGSSGVRRGHHAGDGLGESF